MNQPPASPVALRAMEDKTLEDTEDTEEKMKILRHCGSVLSVCSNDPAQRESGWFKREPIPA